MRSWHSNCDRAGGHGGTALSEVKDVTRPTVWPGRRNGAAGWSAALDSTTL